MSGNGTKLTRNKKGGGGGYDGNVRDAVDLDDCLVAARHIRRRYKREREEHNEALKIKRERDKITLPTTDWLKTFMDKP